MAQSSTVGNKLAQEIYDEFLVCKICLEAYKCPKSLNCLHTFCEACIENHVMSESTYKKYSDYREFTCPLCRKRTQLPIGGVKKLPDNFLVGSLSEVVQRQKPSKYPFCDICKMVNKKHKEAESKCLDCNKLLCKECIVMHRETKVTKNHSLFDVEIEKDIECKEHAEEIVRFYCEPCETCICVLCTFNEHKDHEISQFGDAVTKYKDTIRQLVDSCDIKIGKFDEQLEILNKCEDVVKNAEQKIHDSAIQFIADIRTREKHLVEELHNIYGPVTMDCIQKKTEKTHNMESLRSTCKLTEVILKGKDIELLLLKKNVSEKLSALNDVDIVSLPDTVHKQVDFIPGTVDMGHILDNDRPLLSKMRAKRNFRSTDSFASEEDAEVELATRATQTDAWKPPAKHGGGGGDSSDEDKSSDEDETSDSEDEDDEDNPKVSTQDQATLTDAVQTEEIGVNTRSRSLTGSLSNQFRGRSPPLKDGEAPSDGGQTGMEYVGRRQRRRLRERPRTVEYADDVRAEEGVGGVGGKDMPPRAMSQDDDMSSISQRRRYRHRLTYNDSMDGLDDDSFCSAENSPACSSPL